MCYLQHVIHKARKEGKGYEPRGDEKVAASRELFGGGEIQLPAFWKAIVPIVLVIVLCAFFQLALKPLFGVENLSAMNALVFSMWITSAVTIFLNWDTVHNKLHVIPTLSRGMTEMFPFIVLSGAVYGFGLVTQGIGLLPAAAGADPVHRHQPLLYRMAVRMPDRGIVCRRRVRHGYVAVHLRI